MDDGLWFWIHVLALCYFNRAYLTKPSPYYSLAEEYLYRQPYAPSLKRGFVVDAFLRPVTDLCVLSSSTYALVAVYLFLEGSSLHLVIMNVICFISSVLYHLHAEAAFFNMDNIFATAQAFIFLWSLRIAYEQQRFAFVSIGIVGIGLSAYLLVACGLPAILEFDRENSSRCVCRRANPAYKVYHSVWHAISIGGPLMAATVFSDSSAHASSVISFSSYLPSIPLVPAASLLLSTILNIIGNSQGIMPLK